MCAKLQLPVPPALGGFMDFENSLLKRFAGVFCPTQTPNMWGRVSSTCMLSMLWLPLFTTRNRSMSGVAYSILVLQNNERSCSQLIYLSDKHSRNSSSNI
jgi:hypothetical protein